MKLAELIKNNVHDHYSIRKPYMIAEAGVNHEGSMDLAKRLIEEAAEGGAQAIKFQTYKASTLASKDSPSYWDRSKEPTASQFELFQKYDSFWKNEYEELKVACDEFGIEFMSTAFDAESAHFLNDLMDVFKISSSDLTNHPFIELQCSFGKPILLSTGASTINEISDAVAVINNCNVPLSLMHCVLNYPTQNENAHLGMIKSLQKHFPDYIIGYSDHTLPQDMEVCLNATLLGAEILEKHFTHDKTLPGNDHYHAMDMHDLRKFNELVDHTFELLGVFDKAPLESEEISRQNARRSLVADRDIPMGKVIEKDDLTWKRPAHGISPADMSSILGKEAAKDIEEDTVLQYEMFK